MNAENPPGSRYFFDTRRSLDKIFTLPNTYDNEQVLREPLVPKWINRLNFDDQLRSYISSERMKNVRELFFEYLRACEEKIATVPVSEENKKYLSNFNPTRMTFHQYSNKIEIQARNRSSNLFNYVQDKNKYNEILKLVTDFAGQNDQDTEGILAFAQLGAHARYSVSIPQSLFNYILELYIMTHDDSPEFAFSVQSSPAKFPELNSKNVTTGPTYVGNTLNDTRTVVSLDSTEQRNRSPGTSDVRTVISRRNRSRSEELNPLRNGNDGEHIRDELVANSTKLNNEFANSTDLTNITKSNLTITKIKHKKQQQ